MDKLDNERLGALIIAVAQGDVGAVEQIYNLMGRVMYAVAASYLRELADIEDAVADRPSDDRPQSGPLPRE